MLNINFTEDQIKLMVEERIDKMISSKIDGYLNKRLNTVFGNDRDFNKTVRGMLHTKLDSKLIKIAEETDIEKLIDLEEVKTNLKEVILDEVRDNLYVNLKWS